MQNGHIVKNLMMDEIRFIDKIWSHMQMAI
jgi:hypothetical protein